MAEIPTTQRAYTLRLRGANDNDSTWRDALWATHEVVNKGAKAFGEWILTLRGGLDHTLADDGPENQRKDRRILLALSWLSVEDAHGAPDEYEIDSAKVVDVFADILAHRGLPKEQIAEWIDDCKASLQAAIRGDAVWVNRSAAFDAVAAKCNSLTRTEIWDFLEPFFVGPQSYLLPETSNTDTSDNATEESPAKAKEEKAKDLVQKAGGWLSKRAGSGAGADFETMAKAYEQIAAWAKSANEGANGDSMMAMLAKNLSDFSPESLDANGVLSVISGPGYKSATRNQVKIITSRGRVTRADLDKLSDWAAQDVIESKSKIGSKGPRPYSDMILRHIESVCGFTYLNPSGAARHCEFSVMLDHAARRVNVAHSWIKNAEAERRQFESDARLIADVPEAAIEWLNRYCSQRKDSSGSLEVYRIRKRAIDGWSNVVQRWSRADCTTPEDRVKAARELQDDPEIGKFGDIQLFEALAAEDALCVWKKEDGTPVDQPLKDFVFATDAIAKRQRFKVPAYRHPDPLRHPVFTDFGNSRWGIEFSAHRAPSKLADLAARVEKLTDALSDADKKIATAKNDKRQSLEAKAVEIKEQLKKAQHDHAAMADRYHSDLYLWNNTAIAQVPLRWSCKRLVANLNLTTAAGDDNMALQVSRADRLGRAAVGALQNHSVSIAGLFDEKDWNGRLQVPRRQLDELADYVYGKANRKGNGWDAKAQSKLRRLHWLLSFSAKLQQRGPWFDYCAKFDDSAPARPFVSTKGEYAVKFQANDKRKSLAKLILARLPGLRVLSVDLGHRYAAACAVWETITSAQLAAACKTAGVSLPAPDAIFFHLKSASPSGKTTTTIYRRIGHDKSHDGSIHPAPWARLDRQFLIKLQGEDQRARKASPEEIQNVDQFNNWIGKLANADEIKHSFAVDEMMSDAVVAARLALVRHGRRARIANNLTAQTRTRPGQRVEALTDATHMKLLVGTLADWHALASDDRWFDPAAHKLWNDMLAKLPDGFALLNRDQAKQKEELNSAQRKQVQAALEKKLEPLARTIIADSKLASQLHDAWANRWKSDDKIWPQKLKWLSRWLMPRGGSRRSATRRHVGGLSLMRISTMVDFRRKVQVAFFTRMRPDGNREETNLQFGQKTLDRIERLKENRVKQLASRIVEAALGIGIEKSNQDRDLPRSTQRLDGSRFAPCHCVILEDLEHYRPEQTRTRRENRQTMDWKSAETRKRLADHCQLYGLYLRDVNPQYTSRQDSRTGAPGMRCSDIPVADFITKPWWQKQINAAEKKIEEKKSGTERDRYLLALKKKFISMTPDKWKNIPAIRIPINGGEIFVSTNSNSKGLQADLNAAANIGLRALLDPDFAGKWWYVPCKSATFIADESKVAGCPLFAENKPLGDPPTPASENGSAEKPKKIKRSKNKSTGDIVNRWRSVSATPPQDDRGWQSTSEYWQKVEHKVVAKLFNDLSQ